MSNLEIVILAQWALIVGKAYILKGNSDIQDLKKAVWYIQDEIKRLEDK